MTLEPRKRIPIHAHSNFNDGGKIDTPTVTNQLGLGAPSSLPRHDELAAVTSDQHHAQLHHAEHEPGGGDAMAVDAAQATGSLRTISTSAPSTQAIGDAASAGAGTAAEAHGHKHAMPAFGSPVSVGAANSAGSSANVSHADHVHSSLGGGTGTAGLWDTAIVKASDDTVTNSATLVSDSELTFAVLTGEAYYFELLINYVTDATGDYKCDLAISASTFNVTFRYLGTDTTTNTVLVSTGIKDNAVTNTTDIAAGGGSLSIVRSILIEGFMFISGNATVSFRSAQNTQTAGQSAVTKAGSRLLLRKLA